MAESPASTGSFRFAVVDDRALAPVGARGLAADALELGRARWDRARDRLDDAAVRRAVGRLVPLRRRRDLRAGAASPQPTDRRRDVALGAGDPSRALAEGDLGHPLPCFARRSTAARGARADRSRDARLL